jgi:DNA-binding beta-propeller fold protein YncE
VRRALILISALALAATGVRPAAAGPAGQRGGPAADPDHVARPLMDAVAGRRRNGPLLSVMLLVVVACIAAGCTQGRSQTVSARGTPAAEPTQESTTSSAPAVSVPLPEPPVTIPALPLPTPTTRPPTTTTRPRPTTTLPPVDTVGRPAAYAAAYAGARPDYGIVVPISVAGTAGTPIVVRGTPARMAVTGDGNTLLVANRNGYLTSIDTATNSRRYDIAVCPSAYAVAVTPDGNTAWVTCENDHTVVPVDLLRRQALDPVAVGYQPYTVIITGDGRTVYIVNYNGSSPSDPEGTVIPVNAITRTPGPPIRLRHRREASTAALTSDGRTLYVLAEAISSIDGGMAKGDVFAIDTATNTIVGEFPTNCLAPRSIAITADATTGYLSCPQHIAAITLDHYSEPEPALAHDSRAVALSPDGKTLYSADTVGDLVEIVDPATMRSCGYVKANGVQSLVVVPGVMPSVPCVKPD